MAFPEQEVIALDVARDGACTCYGIGKAGLLLVAVTGAGNAAGEEGGLNEARAIDPPAAVPAPEVGRAEKQLCHGGVVRESVRQRGEVLGRDMAKRGLGKSAFRSRHHNAAAKAEAADIR